MRKQTSLAYITHIAIIYYGDYIYFLFLINITRIHIHGITFLYNKIFTIILLFLIIYFKINFKIITSIYNNLTN